MDTNYGPNSNFDWTKEVADWTDEQLAAWADKHLTPGTLFDPSWHQRQVCVWAQKVLNFAEKNAKILIEQEIDGQALLSVPGTNLYEWINLLPQIPRGNLTRLKTQSQKLIENFKREPLFVKDRIDMILKVKDYIGIQTDFSDPPTNTRQPLLDRDDARTKAFQMFTTNFTNHGKTEKSLHSFCSVSGGAGIGKTRVCHEMRNWCDEFVQQTPLITSCVKIYIDFSGVDALQASESNVHGSIVLGLRMACKALYSCTVQYFDYNILRLVNLRDLFKFDWTVAAIRDSQPGRCAILLVLDGFSSLINENKSMAKEMISSISNYMIGRAKKDNVVIFPVISATVYGELHNLFDTSYNVISLPPLSSKSIGVIFKYCLPTHASWLDFKAFNHLLYLLASTPRFLRAIIEIVESLSPESLLNEDSVESLGSFITSALSSRIAVSNEYLQRVKGFKELLHFVFAGTPMTLLQDSMVKLVHQLESPGVVYRHGDSQALFLPYHHLIKANETYGLFHTTYPRALVPVELLPTPGVPFTWQMFKKLDHALDPVRIQALKYAVGDVCKVSDVLRAKMSNNLLGLELKLEIIESAQEVDPFIKLGTTLAAKEIIKTEAHGMIKCSAFSKYSFLCHPDNPLVDGRQFFTTVDGQKVMIVKGMKSDQTLTTIPFQYIEDWHKQVQNWFENVSEEYHIICLFITNNRIMDIPETMPDSLMLVDASNFSSYYGPFVAKFAELSNCMPSVRDFAISAKLKKSRAAWLIFGVGFKLLSNDQTPRNTNHDISMLRVLEVPRKISLLVDLPNEIVLEILENLDRADLNKLVRINKRYHGLAQYVLEHRKKIRLCGDHSRVLIVSVSSQYDSIQILNKKKDLTAVPCVVSRSTLVSSSFFTEAPTTEIQFFTRMAKTVESREVINGGKQRRITLIEAPVAKNHRRELYLLAVKADLCALILDPNEVDTHAEELKEMIFGCCFMMSARNVIVAVDLSNVAANDTAGLNSVFNQVKLKISKLLNKTVGMCYTIIPINVRTGSNITSNIQPKFDWFSGGSLKQLVLADQLRTNFDESSYKALCEAPLKIQLTESMRVFGIGTVSTGRVISGVLSLNDNITYHPFGHSNSIKSMESFHSSTYLANPGDIIGLHITGRSQYEIQAKFGYCVRTKETTKVNCTIAFRAQIVVMKPDRFTQHQTYKVFYGSSRFPCILWYIFPEGDDDGNIPTRKFKIEREKPNKKLFKNKKNIYRRELLEYKQEVKRMKLEFQAKSSERPPKKQYKKVTAILLPLVHYDVEPFKPTDFEKNYTGKLMIMEKNSIVGVGRVDRVISNSAKTFMKADLYGRGIRDFKNQYNEVIGSATSLFVLPKEQKLLELFLHHVTHNEHAENSIKKARSMY